MTVPIVDLVKYNPFKRTLVGAISGLRPGAKFKVSGDKVEWLDKEQTQPTAEEIAAYIAAATPTVRRKVSRRTIVDRLAEAGKLEAAEQAINAAPALIRWRWNTADYIYADDPDALALLGMIGADPAVILAE